MNQASDALGRGWIERRMLLGAAIRRSRHPLPQAEVGRAVGRPQSCVSVWEKGGIELGIDRVYELEELFGLRHGELLEAAGYVEVPDVAWWCRAQPTPVSPGAGADPPMENLTDFPRLLVGWLREHGPLVEAAALLRERAQDPLALQFLLECGRLIELRLAWDLWANRCADSEVEPSEVMERTVSPTAVERCTMALWGPPAPARPALRLVNE